LDLKIEGLSFELMEQALQQAHEGRLHILGLMKEAMPEPNDISQYAPRIMSININPEKIGALIGPGGKNIKKIIEDTECEVNVDDDGIVTVAGVNTDKCNEALEMVKALTFEPEVGSVYEVKVIKMLDFGAVVEYMDALGKEVLLHVSELAWERTENVSDVVNMGDVFDVKYFGLDSRTGKEKVSRKALLEKPEGYVERPKRPRSDNDRGGRKPFKKRRF